jgi:hypothetical protein
LARAIGVRQFRIWQIEDVFPEHGARLICALPGLVA